MTKSARRATLAIMTLVLVFLAAPIAQAKKQYPPRNPSCSVSPMQVYVGQTVNVSGKNWKPTSTVTLTYRRADSSTTSLGSVTTDGRGAFASTRVIPSDTGAKSFIDFVGPGPSPQSSTSVQCTVTLKLVAAPTLSSAKAPLSITGGMILGLGILGLSLALSVMHRRRARAIRV